MTPRKRRREPSLVAGDRPRLTARETGLLIAAPIIVVAITAVLAVHFVPLHKDAGEQWTVVTAVLTGAGVFVAAVGLPIAIWQLIMLQRDQERLAAQLAAGPDLDIGFEDDDLLSDVQKIYNKALAPDERWFLAIEAINRGTRTARNPKWVLSFTKKVLEAIDADDPLAGGFPGQGPELRPHLPDRPDRSDSRGVFADEEVLNPGDRRAIPCDFKVPTRDYLYALATSDFDVKMRNGDPEVYELAIECRWTSEDALAGHKTLKLIIEYSD